MNSSTDEKLPFLFLIFIAFFASISPIPGSSASPSSVFVTTGISLIKVSLLLHRVVSSFFYISVISFAL